MFEKTARELKKIGSKYVAFRIGDDNVYKLGRIFRKPCSNPIVKPW